MARCKVCRGCTLPPCGHRLVLNICRKKYMRLKFEVQKKNNLQNENQKKIHLTFIHPWVAYTDNCGGDGHAYTDTRTRHFQDLNVTHCSFRPHIHLRQYKHVMLSSTSFFFSSKCLAVQNSKASVAAHTHTHKKKSLCVISADFALLLIVIIKVIKFIKFYHMTSGCTMRNKKGETTSKRRRE